MLGDAQSRGVTRIVPSPRGATSNSHPEPSPAWGAAGSGCLLKENDEWVLKQQEPVFIRVFAGRTNRKSGGSGASARAIWQRRGRQIRGASAASPARGHQGGLGVQQGFWGFTRGVWGLNRGFCGITG